MSTYKQIFATCYDDLMTNAPYDAWVGEIDRLIKLHRAGSKSLLDLACGTGNVTSRLYKKGYQVMGLDLSEEMLMIAQDKAYERNHRIQYLCQDMTRFKIHKKVDVMTCICDGLNYIATQEALSKVFESAAAHLNESGLMIIDLSTPYKLGTVLGDTTIAELGESVSFIWENHFQEADQVLEFDIAFFVKQEASKLYQKVVEHHIQYAHTLETLTGASENWFECLEVKDGECFTPLTNTSERMMMVFRKKSV